MSSQVWPSLQCPPLSHMGGTLHLLQQLGAIVCAHKTSDASLHRRHQILLCQWTRYLLCQHSTICCVSRQNIICDLLRHLQQHSKCHVLPFLRPFQSAASASKYFQLHLLVGCQNFVWNVRFCMGGRQLRGGEGGDLLCYWCQETLIRARPNGPGPNGPGPPMMTSLRNAMTSPMVFSGFRFATRTLV